MLSGVRVTLKVFGSNLLRLLVDSSINLLNNSSNSGFFSNPSFQIELDGSGVRIPVLGLSPNINDQ